MQKLEREYVSSGWHPDYAMTIRDSRQAYWHRYQSDKPPRDLAWFVGSVILVVIVALVLVKLP